MMAREAVPRWFQCQMCRQPLEIDTSDGATDKSGAASSSEALPRGGPQASGMSSGSIFSAGSKLDQSYVVLPRRPSPTGHHHFPPPRPRATGVSASVHPPRHHPLPPTPPSTTILQSTTSIGPDARSKITPGPHSIPPPSEAPISSDGLIPSPLGGGGGGGGGGGVRGGRGEGGGEGEGGGGGGQFHHHQYAGRTMEESFVMLPSSTASIYRGFGDGGTGGALGLGGFGPMPGVHHHHHHGGGGAVVDHSNASLDAKINSLMRVFEISSSQTPVNRPLCLECMGAVCEELDGEIKEAEKDILAYEKCLISAAEDDERQREEALSEEEFLKEMSKAEEEERRLKEELVSLEQENVAMVDRLEELDSKVGELDELEQRFWHDFNDFKLQLVAHQEERDGVLSKIEVAMAQLEMLKHTNVFNDTFHIWHDGEFGTINNFRLGRLPNLPVEWDEINAAWGQACLLLSTMAQACRLTFSSYRILPMGSYPRIADSRNTYDLYGPVNLFWSTKYDKAMVLYLACLKEFADFANARDRAAEVPPDRWFKLPYKIENDKVNGFTIKQSFNRDERWTKALKYMLCDLKWALAWVINNASMHPPSSPLAASSSSSSSLMPGITIATATPTAAAGGAVRGSAAGGATTGTTTISTGTSTIIGDSTTRIGQQAAAAATGGGGLAQGVGAMQPRGGGGGGVSTSTSRSRVGREEGTGGMMGEMGEGRRF